MRSTLFARWLRWSALALLVLAGRPVSAATYYVNSASTDCTSAAGSGTLADPWQSLFHALNTGSFAAGDVIVLRGGTYRFHYAGFSSRCVTSDNTNGMATVLPIVFAGASGNPIIIQNYPGEDVVIEGSDADLAHYVWTPCGSSSWQTTAGDVNVGSARTPQIWINPASAADPGTRLRFDDVSKTCGGMTAGTFRVSSNGQQLFVRLPNNSSANSADIHMSCQNGDCAWTPVHANSSAAYVTVQKNPAGGNFYVKYGYYNIRIDGSAHDLLFDGIQIVAAGGRDYGQCVRAAGGANVTVQNGTCRESMSEGIGFYGGGPGTGVCGLLCAGVQISGMVLANEDVYDTGRTFFDQNGTTGNLGMGVVVKNCNGCTVRQSRIRNVVADGIFITTSKDNLLTSDGVVVDRNEIYNYGYLYNKEFRTTAAIDIEPQNNVTGGAVRNIVVTNNYIHNEIFKAKQGEAPEGIVVSDSGYKSLTAVSIINNSIQTTQDFAIDFYGAAGAGHVVRNNALSMCGQVLHGKICYMHHSGVTHDHNTYWSGLASDNVVNSAGTFFTRANVAVGFESSAVQTNPLFVSPGNLDLQSTSPLIDAGSNFMCPAIDFHGTSRPQGIACDIGAYELGLPPVPVPSVVNLTQAAATTALTGAGLVVGTVTTAMSATVPAGSVISQNPTAGTQVAPASAVGLVVSSGPPVSVPNVVNLPQVAAATTLTGASLVVGTVTSAPSPTVPSDSVISENPLAGMQVASGSAVNLVVSIGPPVSVPNVVNLPQAAATTALTGASLVVGTVTTATSPTVPADSVISETPLAGMQVASGSAVNLVVSTGPALVTVPNVVTLTQAAATTAITGVGLVVGTVTTAASATVPAGAVISENPLAGTQVAAGSAVNLVVSTGPALVTVPNVVTLTQAAATTAITGAGLVVGTVTTAASATVPAGAVISENPLAGTQVAAGSAVNLVVSTGPALVTVPNVVTLTQAAATTAITGAGLVVGTVTTATSATVPAGSVISENPAAGTQVAPASLVSLVVSSGPPVAVPNVVTLTQAAATTAITGAGLVVGTVTTAASTTVPAGAVISENPLAGTQVASGSAVNLVVSTGPALVTVPNVVTLTQAAATTAITGAGLVVGAVTTASSTTVPAGSVISQDPTAGTQVAPASLVSLVVSSGPPVAVPNVVTLTQAAAATAITGAGLVVGTVTTATSATVPAGAVISENPLAGTQVAAGSAVNLVVSTGPALVTVPNVVTLTQAAATTAITGAGLVVGTVTTATSATVPAGSVISENPAAGTQVAPASLVSLVVSSGPPVAVPNVVTLTQAAATTAITGAGLVVGTVTTATSATVPAGAVISENPLAGTQVAAGSTVNLVVSTGPLLVAVPNVVTLTQAAATTAITGAGLVVGTVTTATSATVPAGAVISESPLAGTQVAAGSAVNFVVSSGPPVAVPNVVNLTQAAATTAITGVGLVVGTVTTATSATVPAGSVISQNPIAGTQVAAGSAMNLVVSTGLPPNNPVVDVTVFSEGAGTRVTPAITTTAAGDVLVAFAGSDGPSAAKQTLTISGAGLTWTLVARSNTQAGTAEIWTAKATGILTSATVQSVQSATGFRHSLTVVAFRNASGIGASAIANAATGAPTVTLITTRANSLVYGVGNDWSSAIARSLGPNQAMTHQWVDTSTGDTYWVQNLNAPVVTSGTTVQLNDTAPLTDRWNIAAVEIVP